MFSTSASFSGEIQVSVTKVPPVDLLVQTGFSSCSALTHAIHLFVFHIVIYDSGKSRDFINNVKERVLV